MPLILASASPRRRELLRAAGISFTTQPTDIPEIPAPGEAPRAFAERLARQKALAVEHQHPDSAVLGADTIVVVDAEILGKPTDAADAARMLRLLSGRTHDVITAVCLVPPTGAASSATQIHLGSPADPIASNSPSSAHRQPIAVVDSEITRVTFAPLTDADIDFYISTGEPMDKAGAYAIQGIASRWIPRIEGDYSNVVGLPVALVYRMLREHHLL